jgi:hypothetical protein
MTAVTSNGVEPAIAVRDLTVAYDERPVLWDIDLDVPTIDLITDEARFESEREDRLRMYLYWIPFLNMATTAEVRHETFKTGGLYLTYAPDPSAPGA